ncbi:hypothetical protein Bhyg_03358 [Pseudolycoriella hygida]|uniref:Uncharacterized protein n=1 Tax=Pseudolycoriella hygida TaxID=35572 RepID=A0A9Q0NDJ1_9DIPT|nr:hypothetical protein Bhyg_03358 [Pseudolycoriella hygida]
MGSDNDIWLIGKINQFLPEEEVPTIGDVLRCFFYHYNCSKQKGPTFIYVAKQLVDNWMKLGKAVVAQRDVVQRIRKLVETYDAVKKSRHRQTLLQLSYEKNFLCALHHTFDIAPKNNYHHHQSGIESMETSYHHQNKHKVVQEPNLNMTKADINDSVEMELDDTGYDDELIFVADESTSDEEVQPKNDDKDFETTLTAYYRSQFSSNELDEENDEDIIYKIINSPDVSSALDRTNTSTGSFVIILAAIARALDVDLTECVFSTSTLLRRRAAHREVIKADVKNEFLASIASGLVVHFDGKRLKDTTNQEKDERNKKVDRIAIVVTGLNIQKVLAIAKTDDGSGLEVSDTVHEHLEAWSILESIVTMCTDTTRANTGEINGACVLLEKKLKRNVIYLACRHHMLELIIGAIFVMLFGETTGPYTEMFENFKRDWSQVDKTSFKPLDKKIFRKKYLKDLRDDVLSYIEEILAAKDKKFVPRGDYLEMMELCLLVLGKSIPRYTFKLPHSCNNARWMGKVIYCFKIFLFREQVNLSDSELINLEEFCVFACLAYTKSWIQCCVPSNAPQNDLDLLKSLNRYERINSEIANCAIEKFQNHLWYLGSELVVLALFSDKVGDTVKSRMFEKMKCLDAKQWTERDCKLTFEKKIYKKELFDLVGPSSMTVLKSLKIDIDFMFENDVRNWKHIDECGKAKEIVDSFKVVNDTAERALKMMTDFNQSLTHNEEGKQDLLQVVEDNRENGSAR